MPSEPLAEPLAVTLRITGVFEDLGVVYAIGGSLASAVHGIGRATMDVDIVAELGLEDVPPLLRAVSDQFYVEEAAVRDAVLRHGSFNLIHLETMFKVDIFVAGTRSFDRAQLARRELYLLDDESRLHAYVATAEDTILAKLEWYRLGDGVSDRQWRDVLGVIEVQGDRLDRNYLRRMAATLDVADLLEQALGETA